TFRTMFRALWDLVTTIPGRGTAFPNHIRGILFVRPREEVIWVHARWVVAAMTDHVSLRRVAVNQRPRNSASYLLPSVVVSQSVPFRQTPALPLPPTGIGFTDLLPKPDLYGFPSRHRNRRGFPGCLRKRPVRSPEAVGGSLRRVHRSHDPPRRAIASQLRHAKIYDYR